MLKVKRLIYLCENVILNTDFTLIYFYNKNAEALNGNGKALKGEEETLKDDGVAWRQCVSLVSVHTFFHSTGIFTALFVLSLPCGGISLNLVLHFSIVNLFSGNVSRIARQAENFRKCSVNDPL